MKKLKVTLTLLVTKDDIEDNDNLDNIIKYLQSDIKTCIQEELAFTVTDLEIVEGA